MFPAAFYCQSWGKCFGDNIKILDKTTARDRISEIWEKIKTDYSDNTSVKVKMNSRLTFLLPVSICMLLSSVNIVAGDENIETQDFTRLDHVDERHAEVREWVEKHENLTWQRSLVIVSFQFQPFSEIKRQDVVQNTINSLTALVTGSTSTLSQVLSTNLFWNYLNKMQVFSVLVSPLSIISNVLGLIAISLLNLLGATFSLGGFVSQAVARSLGASQSGRTQQLLLLAYSAFAGMFHTLLSDFCREMVIFFINLQPPRL